MGQCTWSLHRKRLASASGVRGGAAQGSIGRGKELRHRALGFLGEPRSGASGSWGGALGPGVEPREHGWSRALEPGDQGGASSCGSDNSNSSTFKPGARHRRRLGTRVRSAFITYRRERALVLQGPGDGGTRRVSVAQVGAGGCALWGGSGSLLPGKADWSQTARLQGSHFAGAGGTLGGFTAFPAASRPPSSPSVTSQTPGITTSPKAPLFWPGEPARSREELPRRKGAEGRERGGGGGDTMQEVSRTPADTSPIPFSGQNPSNLLAFPRRFIRNSPLDVPLNKTIRSKTRKPRLLLESPISPFATWIPVLQECEAAKSEPVILFR